ncbi:ABC transporter permease subunit [candidate division WOR-3 bacterium]|uniref:ABC transporter permease subunit n=1 Tax=candidate division WOR-3 bacterium TaxID=2052148 RepID=A0A9D5KB71_UNCW3|nr:ABC transporter permease subunit [candidate division WOR-3 bacterium]MBD3364945.1 ABC transporter permease subunit [candidate division WOR-3 bacterium]
MFRGAGLIYRKEMWTAFREKRTFFFLILFPLLVWPLFTVLPMLFVGGREKKAQEKPSPVVLITPYEMPELRESFASSEKIELVEVDDPTSAISDDEASCVVYADSVSADSMILYTRIFFDATKTESKVAADKVELILSTYGQKVVKERLSDQGIDERLLNAVSVIRENAVNPQQMFGFYTGFIIGMFIVMGSLMGASSIVIDSTAGEKERKTLELLLTAPIPRSAIMFGKYLAGLTFAFISPILTALGMSLAAAFVVPLISSAGSGLNLTGMLSAGKIGAILLIILLLAAFIVALLMAIAVRTRSTKQAGAYMAPLNIIMVIPIMFMQIIPAVPPTWMFAVPFLNVMLVLRGMLMNTLPPTAIIFTLASMFVFLMLAMRFAARGFGSEKVLLN